LVESILNLSLAERFSHLKSKFLLILDEIAEVSLRCTKLTSIKGHHHGKKSRHKEKRKERSDKNAKREKGCKAIKKSQVTDN